MELTGFIKEVRNNKHGSLTGLSLEDIVSSVSDLVELKKKVTIETFDFWQLRSFSRLAWHNN